MIEVFDLAIIGGGVNGCGIARDAAGRGLSVLLCEKGDLGSGTSSTSTKLIHGGLRYLEHFEFKLVSEALQERETLLYLAPHIVKPMRFILPHNKSMRPAWMLRVGLFLYDFLGRRKVLPASRFVKLRKEVFGKYLKADFQKAFAYSDCWVDDSRLVVLNAVDAKRLGAEIRTKSEVTRVVHEDGLWHMSIQDRQTGKITYAHARALVNAGGPWAGKIAQAIVKNEEEDSLRLVKGSHIIFPRLFDHDHAYIFQNDDERIVFAIPYEKNFTLVGTTDVEFEGDPSHVEIDNDEEVYLCEAINRYLANPVGPGDVVFAFSGVRPLFDDGADDAKAASRDYVLQLEGGMPQTPPLLTVYGGKITTYRELSEEVMAKLGPHLHNASVDWTADEPLPGGRIGESMEAFKEMVELSYPWVPQPVLERWVWAYGTRVEVLLAGKEELADLGECFDGMLYEAEIEYLRYEEWARSAEDILWRRSKLGMVMSEGEQRRLYTYVENGFKFS
jgi:glycerol-3-phosphate dehydrogenase